LCIFIKNSARETDPMNLKAVVLGSTGFVGAALLEKLQQHNGLVVEGYHSSTLDLTSPDCADRLTQIADEKTILIVTARAHQKQDQLELFWDNVAIAMSIARCLSRKRVKKCVYFSTLSVYGDAQTNLDITEETSIAPTSLYGIAKFTGESIIRQVAAKKKIPWVILRPCKIYGPGDCQQTYGPVGFIRSILEEKKAYLFGEGTELRDHVFIRDVVQITIQLALSDQHGIYNLGTGQSDSFQKIIACLRKIIQQDFEVIHLIPDKPKVDQRINISKLLTSLPGFNFTGLEQGLQETYQQFAAKFVSGV